MTNQDDEKTQRLFRNLLSYESLIFLMPLTMFGFMGFLFNSSNRISGFLWGFGIGLAVLLICLIGILGWKWLEGAMAKGRLLPYLLVGFLAAITISGILAINLGKPTCDEQGDPPYNSCVSYADDGFEASSSQKWDKFWATLPITVIISLLIAALVHSKTNNHKK